MRIIYKCSCNGILNKSNVNGIQKEIKCSNISKCDPTLCRAHGLTKCKHKIKLGEI